MTLEDFIEGDFEKYINTGEFCRDDTSEISLKAEAFVHFTCQLQPTAHSIRHSGC